jgi:hypothetical protein
MCAITGSATLRAAPPVISKYLCSSRTIFCDQLGADSITTCQQIPESVEPGGVLINSKSNATLTEIEALLISIYTIQEIQCHWINLAD